MRDQRRHLILQGCRFHQVWHRIGSIPAGTRVDECAIGE